MVPMTQSPRIGDMVVAEILSVGKNKTLEVRSGVTMYLFEGDRIMGAFGNRYATDQYEGYVPEEPVDKCDLLSVGGVCGEVVSRHSAMGEPTKLRVLGMVGDRDGRPINQRGFGLPPQGNGGGDAEVILVIGSSMNAGKTTTVGTLTRALSRAGFSVAAGKVTGTAAGKDGRFFASCGARPALDFTTVGYPSTYMIGLDELLMIYHDLLAHLRAADPDYIILEVADGIFQRETRMLLESAEFREGADHVFFAAGDSLSAESGGRVVKDYGLPLRATAGAITQSVLATREAEEATGLPCLSVKRIMDGTLMEVLDTGRTFESNGRNRDYVTSPIGRRL
ncbi:MAG: DUF1611 domain-containing protein [Rubrobacter sp.]